MEHIETNKTVYGNVDKTGTQVIGTTPVTPPNSTDVGVVAATSRMPLSIPATPERTASQQQQLKKNSKLPPQHRRAVVNHVPVTGAAQKGPATPRSRNNNASQGSSSSQRSSPGPPSASRGHKRSVTASRTFEQIQAEHLYLFSNLQQQEAHPRYQVQPQTPYLVPQNGPVLSFPESHEAAHGSGMNSTCMTAISPISPNSWQERRGGGNTESMSPMSPLAPVFQPGASFFFGHTGAVGGTDAGMADAADNNDAAGDDAAAKQESLGGTTFTGEVDEKVGEDERIVDFTPRSVAKLEDATAIQHNLISDAEIGVADMHYVFDADGNDDTGVDVDIDDSNGVMPREIRLRRGSHDGKQQQQQPLSAREKRMSLPPVRFSWPEKE
ncbi:hypothetical protein F503_05074 [Ophiostoma piceae UAMH 11346]|uniref:Uncharacterized protein n=1 Tax=Ophiostoma piceae (strain UAMH 11346) TaxID=1262450 RepID=S3C8Y9_OPHP1|nr:hypothetical protein F503_05074 [Ophiostoma piceae UAMH 11346]